MIEDYYKVINLSPNAGQLKIAISYLKLSNKYYALIKENETYKEEFYRVNRALEVVRDEIIRNYYDIIYRENLNGTLNLNNYAIQKYMIIVNEGIAAGNNKADWLLTNSEHCTQRGVIQTRKIFWLKFLVYVNPKFLHIYKYIYLPILSLIYLISGLTIVMNQIENFNRDNLIVGIAICLLSTHVLYMNLANYILDKVSNKASD